MNVTCFCGKIFTDGLKIAKHRIGCREFQVKHYHSQAGSGTIKKIPLKKIKQ